MDLKTAIYRIVTVAALVLAANVAELKAAGKPAAGPSYQIVKLDDLGGAVRNGVGYDVNNWREVVGYVDDAVGGTGRYAAHWMVDIVNGQSQSTLILLGRGSASGINNAGEIVGQTKDANGHPVGAYWRDTQSAVVELSPLPGHDSSGALAINDDGMICGRSAVAGGGWQTFRAVAWRVQWVSGAPVVFGPVELPGPADGSSAFAVNSTSNGVAEVAGVFEATQTAVVWQVLTQANGSLSVAPAPDMLDTGAQAQGINNAGAVCGLRGNEAVVWNGNTTVTLNRPKKGKTAIALAAAFDISNTGVVVGIGGPNGIDSRAVVWQSTGGTMMFLDSFLNSNSPLLGLSTAEAVNDHGEIVGEGWEGAFIAIPK